MIYLQVIGRKIKCVWLWKKHESLSEIILPCIPCKAVENEELAVTIIKEFFLITSIRLDALGENFVCVIIPAHKFCLIYMWSRNMFYDIVLWYHTLLLVHAHVETEWSHQSLAWARCNVKPELMFKLPVTIKWKTNLQKSNLQKENKISYHLNVGIMPKLVKPKEYWSSKKTIHNLFPNIKR